MQTDMRDLLGVAGNTLHLDCGGGYMDFTWVQFIVHIGYFDEVDSKRKKQSRQRCPTPMKQFIQKHRGEHLRKSAPR